MNNSPVSFIKNIIRGRGIFNIVLISLILLFSSCENFLKGSDTKAELDQAIAYANAKEVNVSLSCKEEMGTIFPQPTYQARLDFEFEVQFIPNTDNYIVTDASSILKAVSRINEEESRADCVEFTPVEQNYEDKKAGLYRVKVKIVKYADDIKLIPACPAVPKIKDIYPPYNPAGYNQDTVIKITFSKAVDPQSFGNFNCISFNTAEGNISSCYGTPYFSSDNTVLYIPTVPGKRIIEDDSQSNNVDVTIKIDCTNIKDAQGLSIVQSEPYIYCLKKQVDGVNPIIKSVQATTTGDTTAWYYRELTDKAFDQWSAAEVKEADNTTVKYYYGDFSQNHVGNSIHISLQGYDNADAVASVCVKEVFVKTASGDEAGTNGIRTYYENIQIVTDENGNIVFTEDGKTLYAIDFDYEFKNGLNGLISLEISLVDGAGNHSVVKNYSVIKMSGITRKLSFDLAVDPDFNASPEENLPQLINGRYKSHIGVPLSLGGGTGLGTVPTFNFSIGETDYIYGNYESTCSSFVIYFFDENDNPITVFEKKNFTEYLTISYEIGDYLKNVLIDTYRDTKAKAVFYEANGIKKELDFTIPAPGEILAVNNNNILTTNVVYKPGAEKNLYYVTYKESEDADVSKFWKRNYLEGDKDFNLTDFKDSNKLEEYPNGIYTFYVKESSIYGETVAEGCTIRRGFTKPFTYIKGNSNIQTLNWYPSITIKTNTIESSTKIRTVEFNIDYPSDEYLYYIVVHTAGKVFSSEERAKTISFPYLKDSNGSINTYYSIVKKDSYQNVVGITMEFYIPGVGNYDISPPMLKYSINSNNSSQPFHYHDASYFYFDDYEIINNDGNNNRENGDVEFICYYLPINVGENPSVDVVKNESVYSTASLTIKNTGIYPGLEIPFYDLDLGEYYLYAYLKDAAGNEACERIANKYYDTSTGKVSINNRGVKYYLMNGSPSVKKNVSETIEYIMILGPNNDTSMYKYYLKKNTDGKWEWAILLKEDATTLFYSSHNNKYENEKNRFIKVISFNTTKKDCNQQFGFAHFRNYYYFPNYIMEEVTCNSTSWLKVENGYQIFCDAPAFAHTMYSKIKITETTTKDDALEWETRAHETGIVVDSEGNGFTYKDAKDEAGDNLYEVPDGDWYTIICHFADGTVLMSPVQQMHR